MAGSAGSAANLEAPAPHAGVDALERLEALLRRTLPANIEITRNAQRDLWPVLVDKGQFDQVLMNLAVNAKDAMPNGGRIAMTLENITTQTGETRFAGDFVRLRVSDTGCGIAPEILPRVFDPFFTTKGPGKGTGLGLASCYAIVGQAGGELSID